VEWTERNVFLPAWRSSTRAPITSMMSGSSTFELPRLLSLIRLGRLTLLCRPQSSRAEAGNQLRALV